MKPTPEWPANKVRQHRKTLQMTQLALCQAARRRGYSLGLRTVYNVETGKPCRQDTKRAILSGLGLDWDDRFYLFSRPFEVGS